MDILRYTDTRQCLISFMRARAFVGLIVTEATMQDNDIKKATYRGEDYRAGWRQR
ncbi:hypothetical protein OS31_01990 [Dickeya oryzae]